MAAPDVVHQQIKVRLQRLATVYLPARPAPNRLEIVLEMDEAARPFYTQLLGLLRVLFSLAQWVWPLFLSAGFFVSDVNGLLEDPHTYKRFLRKYLWLMGSLALIWEVIVLLTFLSVRTLMQL